MTEKYLIMISVYLTLILVGLYFKSKRLKRELDKANIQNSKLSKALDIKRQEPLFGDEYEVVRVGHQTGYNELDSRLNQLPADVLQMKQKQTALHEIVEELDRIGAIEVFRGNSRPETPIRRVDYELKVLVKK